MNDETHDEMHDLETQTEALSIGSDGNYDLASTSALYSSSSNDSSSSDSDSSSDSCSALDIFSTLDTFSPLDMHSNSDVHESASPNLKSFINLFGCLLRNFRDTYKDYRICTSVHKVIGFDLSNFLLAFRYMIAVNPHIYEFPGLLRLFEEILADLRNVSLEMYADITQTHLLMTRVFKSMDIIQNAFNAGKFTSSDASANLSKKLVEETTYVLNLLNTKFKANRLRIRYFFILRCMLLSYTFPN